MSCTLKIKTGIFTEKEWEHHINTIHKINGVALLILDKLDFSFKIRDRTEWRNRKSPNCWLEISKFLSF